MGKHVKHEPIVNIWIMQELQHLLTELHHATVGSTSSLVNEQIHKRECHKSAEDAKRGQLAAMLQSRTHFGSKSATRDANMGGAATAASGAIATAATGAIDTTVIIIATTSHMLHEVTKRMGWHKTQIKIHSAKVCHPTPTQKPPIVKTCPQLLSRGGCEPPPPCHMKLALPPHQVPHWP